MNVAQPTGRYQREPESEGVTSDNQLEFGGTATERLLDGRQANIDLGQVENRERRNSDADPEGLPLQSVGMFHSL